MDADAGIEGLIFFGHGDAGTGGGDAGAGAEDEIDLGFPGALEYLGKLAGRVLVEVGV